MMNLFTINFRETTPWARANHPLLFVSPVHFCIAIAGEREDDDTRCIFIKPVFPHGNGCSQNKSLTGMHFHQRPCKMQRCS